MKKVMKDVIKNGLILFVVGALLAMAAPFIADVVGADVLTAKAFEHAKDTPVVWTALFFGAFGAIHAAVTPTLTALFREEKTGGEKTKVVAIEAEKTMEKTKAAQIEVTHPKEPEASPVAFADPSFQERLASERENPALQQQIL